MAVGGWSGHILHYKDCEPYIDWVEVMAYDCPVDKIAYYTDSATKTLNSLGFSNNKILMGVSWDKNGDNESTVEYKRKYVEDNGLRGMMLWECYLGENKQPRSSAPSPPPPNLPPIKELKIINKVRGEILPGIVFRGNGQFFHGWVTNWRIEHGAFNGAI